MIYRYREQNVYYAGINYASRIEDIVNLYNRYTFCRMDICGYRDTKDNEHILYRGVDVVKDRCRYYNCTVLIGNDYWEVYDGHKWHKEEYPHDL